MRPRGHSCSSDIFGTVHCPRLCLIDTESARVPRLAQDRRHADTSHCKISTFMASVQHDKGDLADATEMFSHTKFQNERHLEM